MKKWDFVKSVAEETGLSQEVVNKVIDSACKKIVEEVRDNGEDISLQQLGTFRLKENKARTGRNPLTGATIEVKASRTIQFRPMPSIKQIIEDKPKKGKNK